MTARSAAAARSGWRRFVPGRRRVLLGMLGGFVLLVVLFGIGYATTSIPSPNLIASSQSTILYYSDGHTELARLGVDRQSVPLSEVPSYVRDAVLAAEDRNYYSEPGISPTGILRALWVDATGGSIQGGSTITQQYAKNAYLSQARTFTRKIREIFIAVKLDRTRSKDKVLEDYLNTIYFGRGAYGIEAAARSYFGVSVSRLTVAQGAVLAATIRSPGYYDPLVHPAQARGRWAYVVAGMVTKHWLDPVSAARLRYPTVLRPRYSGVFTGWRGYVVKAVEAELATHGVDEARLAIGGFKIVTTIDKTAQGAAVAAEDSVLAQHRAANGDPLSALIAVQPGDGAIRAMYGGRDYANPQVPLSSENLATDELRQPGSSFKPYVLLTALQQGIGLNTVFDGSSPKFVQGYGTNNQVTNDSGEQCPRCPLSVALARSINTVFVPLAIKVGPDAVAATAHLAGIPASVSLTDASTGHADASLALGTAPVHVIDQAIGFATIAAHGLRAQPYLVVSVTQQGNSVYTARLHVQQVFDPNITALATEAMQGVLACPNGTACGKALAAGRPAAGKTGTTTNSTNAWFVGFTPQLSTAVWLGNGRPGQPLTNVPGFSGGVYGGELPAEIWQQFMNAALAAAPVVPFASASPTAGPGSAGPTATPTPTPTRSPSPSRTPSAAPSVHPSSIAPTGIAPSLPGASPSSGSPTPAPTTSPSSSPSSPVGTGSPGVGATAAPARARGS
ncbi:MAG TPA: transglycosylase domain-containing protein [Mycobacteriales bacterium]|nr:transglycosylase domain-containing protein [Mycobacteriales bacterium]